MPYRLNKGVYAVRCRHPRCTFDAHLEIVDTIMGMTEADVGTEARKMARDMASVKHDSLHGRHHTLHKPEIRMVSGHIQLNGAGHALNTPHPVDFYEREYMKGDVILKKGEGAAVVCEVLHGVAYPARNKDHKYALGDCFGVAALLPNRQPDGRRRCRRGQDEDRFLHAPRAQQAQPAESKPAVDARDRRRAGGDRGPGAARSARLSPAARELIPPAIRATVAPACTTRIFSS